MKNISNEKKYQTLGLLFITGPRWRQLEGVFTGWETEMAEMMKLSWRCSPAGVPQRWQRLFISEAPVAVI